MEHPPAVAETFTIRYHITRNVLLGIWWRRLLLRPIRLCFDAVIMLIVGVITYPCFGDFGLYLAGFLLLCHVALPSSHGLRLGKLLAEPPRVVEPKTAESWPSQLIISGAI